jgi:hypothetical protein
MSTQHKAPELAERGKDRGTGRKTMQLGQKVCANAHLVRKTIINPGHGWGFAGKEWQRSVYPAPRVGILVGLRTVTNGLRVNLGEDGIAYKATSHQRVAVVAFDLRQAPKLVQFGDLTF